MAISENYIERKLVKEIKKLNGLCLKFISPSMNGVPDRIILMPDGVLYFVELKAPKGVVSAVQRAVHILFKKLGFKVHVIATLEQLNDFIHLVKILR